MTIALFIGVLEIPIFIEWGLVDLEPVKAVKGLIYSFVEKDGHNLWLITGIIGAVIMQHNFFLHTASNIMSSCLP